MVFASCFFLHRWTSSLAKSAKNPLCELSQNNLAGEEDAVWPPPKKYGTMFDSCVCLSLGDIDGSLQLNHSQYLHHSLPPSGVLALAELITMGTVNPPESHAQK